MMLCLTLQLLNRVPGIGWLTAQAAILGDKPCISSKLNMMLDRGPRVARTSADRGECGRPQTADRWFGDFT